MRTIITQKVLPKFTVRLTSTERSESNHDSNQQFRCSCRFLGGAEQSRCGGSFGSQARGHSWGHSWCHWLPTPGPELGSVIPAEGRSHQLGAKPGGSRRQLHVKENASPLRNWKSVECFMLFSSVCWFCFPPFTTTNSQTSFILSICISVLAHVCYHRTLIY